MNQNLILKDNELSFSNTSLLSQTWDNYITNNFNQVLKDSILEINKNNIFNFIHISGLSLISIGETEKGIDYLTASILLFPSIDWFYNAAFITLENNKFLESINFAKSGLEIFPDDPKICFILGNAYLRYEQYSLAIESYLKVIRKEPFNLNAKLNIGICFKYMEIYD